MIVILPFNEALRVSMELISVFNKALCVSMASSLEFNDLI